MKKLFLLLVAVFALCLGASAQQTYKVSGTVVFAGDGEPLLGATVLPVGGGNGVATDIDGKFTLNIPTTITKLRVSYVGMITREVDITSGEMLIQLDNSENSLDEVMVVAYGTAKKSAFTGSAAVVGADEIEQRQVTNPLDALSGKVSGVQLNNATGQPGSTPTLRIRGITSVFAGNSPLIVVDGTPYGGDVNMISTTDIESMTVLKDAAANALYGARGANGVILITTKQGKQGEAKVTLDAKWGGNSRATRNYNTINSPAQYYETYYKALNNYAQNYLGYSSAAAHTWANNNLTASNSYGLGYNVYNVPDGQMMIGTNGKLNPNATLGNIVTYNGEQYLLYPDNWLDEAYCNNLRQEYNLNISQATDKSSFYASFGYLDNGGLVENAGYQRLNGRLVADLQAKPWLKVGGNIAYTHYNVQTTDDGDEDGSTNSSGNIFAEAISIAPIYPLYMRDASGNILRNDDGIIRYDYGDRTNAGLERPSFTSTNAISDNLLNTHSHSGNAINATGYVEIRFLNDFKLTSNNNISNDEARYTSVTNPYYGQYATSNGITEKWVARETNYTLQQLLTYTHQFDKHNVNVLVGHENYWEKYALLDAYKSNMFDPNNSELAGAITDGSSTSYTTLYNNEGWLFRGQYDYDSKYFGSVSYRRDASSRFHPDHRWGNFWSIGAAWIIDKENWFNADFVDMLKIKASYGVQGNDNIGNYRYTNVYEIVNGGGYPAAVPSTMGNEDITWESNGNFNAGVEFSLFKDRLSGSVEGFYRKTTDMLFSFPLAPSYGYTSYYANVGDMVNRGLELDLTGKVFSTRDFLWEINLNMTWYKNKISYLPEERKTMEIDGVNGFSSGNYFYGEGQPMYVFYMAKYAGVDPDTGEAMYYYNVTDADGNVTGQETTTSYSSASNYLCGTALPTVYGGFGTFLQFKGFDLSVDFTYQLGGQVYDTDYATSMGVPTSTSRGYVMHSDLLNAWSPTNTSSNIPRLQYGDSYATSTSDRFLTSASYLSLQNINFGYTLPSKVCRSMMLEKLRVYLSCDNVYVWSKRQGLDPRQSISGSSTAAYYSLVRTISGGINVTF